jgi:5,5'-dehydrodivanillate O-demethylase
MDSTRRRGDRLRELTLSTPESDMGRLLRRFWQPVAIAEKIAPGRAYPLRILNEELTIYRGQSGEPHLVGSRCAHRSTILHTGWVEGNEIRCMYHGWKYDGTGQCTERPAERDTGSINVRIAGYPTREYAGLIFAYFGPAPVPEFQLPRKDVCERPNGLIFARAQTWNCNWFQSVENAMDAVHVSFVHQKGRVGTFGQVIRQTIPELEYVETDSGIRQTATRGPDNVRVSDWTFPNSNHIVVPGPTVDDVWIDVCSWKLPIDDTSHVRFTVWSLPPLTPEQEQRVREHFETSGEYDPTQHHDELFYDESYPTEPVFQLTSAQDYVAQVGQGTIVDREVEILGRSDAGIALMRRIFFREMEAIREGRPTKEWRRLDQAAELPIQA